MYPDSDREPMCNRYDRGDFEPGDYEESWENDGTGGKVKVTNFSDGSSITHFGGPCGPVRTDRYGNEC